MDRRVGLFLYHKKYMIKIKKRMRIENEIERKDIGLPKQVCPYKGYSA